MKRIPDIDQVASLSRDDWQDLCAAICSLIYGSRRVEDRFGKGNGLDAWREVEEGTEGWQFRRLDARLGQPQINNLKENLILAHRRSIEEMQKPLITFTAVINIDPQPGHKGSKGEIERVEELRRWAKENYGITFTYKGVTWIRTQLLKNPYLRPDLFEDLGEAIKEARDIVLDDLLDIKRKLSELTSDANLKNTLHDTFQKILQEAIIHYERGEKCQNQDEFIKAKDSLEDALRLLRIQELDVLLEGKILSLLAGIEAVIGNFHDAIEHGRKAIEILMGFDSNEYISFAKGNLGFALYLNNNFEESEVLLLEVLKYYEDECNFAEIVRTLTHLTQLNICKNTMNLAFSWASRLRESALSLSKMIGPSDLSLSAMGTAANVLSAASIEVGRVIDKKMLLDAIKAYEFIEEISEKAKFERMKITSKAQRAFCIWHMDNISEAEKLYAELINEAQRNLPKVAADCQFNRAKILLELKRVPDSIEAFLDAKDRYNNIGDLLSMEDVDRELSRILK